MPLFEIRHYANDLGHSMQARVPVNDIGTIDGPTTYHAMGQLVFQLPNGQQGAKQFPFDIPGAMLGEAFANFPAAMEAARAQCETELKREMQAAQRTLVMPNGQSLPPAGRPQTRFAR